HGKRLTSDWHRRDREVEPPLGGESGEGRGGDHQGHSHEPAGTQCALGDYGCGHVVLLWVLTRAGRRKLTQGDERECDEGEDDAEHLNLTEPLAIDQTGQSDGDRRVRGRGDGHRHQRTGAESRSEEHTSELQSRENLVCRLLLEKKKT